MHFRDCHLFIKRLDQHALNLGSRLRPAFHRFSELAAPGFHLFPSTLSVVAATMAAFRVALLDTFARLRTRAESFAEASSRAALRR